MGTEILTSQELIFNLFNSQYVGRIPLYPFFQGFAASFTGIPISMLFRDAKISYQAQLNTQQHFGFDWGPIYKYTTYGDWEFGGILTIPECLIGHEPDHGKCPIESESDIDRIEIPNIKTAGCLPVAKKFSQLQEKNNTQITLSLAGPLTIAANICPINLLFKWMIEQPEHVHKILLLVKSFLFEIVQEWICAFSGERVVVQISEPLSSNQLISPSQFNNFVFPYLYDLAQNSISSGIEHIFYHLCGNQKQNLPLWAKLPMGNPGIVSIESNIDILEAMEIFKGKAVIAGNIDPLKLLNSSPKTIYEDCRFEITRAVEKRGGFMLASGCEMAFDTPILNIMSMRKAIDDYGWY